ncbi:ABC transporter ATP-binding protein [Frankia canadensis]|nr:ABC transporter ATP-binding protein [Frankia canadensis]
MSSPQPIELIRLSKVYGTGAAAVTALDSITLSFPSGSFTAVMGPSGSGKSTLLHCAAGLERPTGGQVLLAGTDLTSLKETVLTRLRRERVGFVFQSFNLIAALTAEQNIALPLRLAGRRPKRAELHAALHQVGLADRAGHLPNQLSGGQQQRVAIARALVTRPHVLFADEPTGALDRNTSREMLTALRSLVDGSGLTTIMVTHDPLAASYAHRVVFLADSRLAGELVDPTIETVAARMTRLEGLPC